MMNTKSVSPIWATNSGVITGSSRSHDDHEDTRTPKGLVRVPRVSSCLRDASFSVRSDGLPRAPVRDQRAPPFPDVGLVLVPEMLQRRHHRRDGGVPERAEGLAADVGRDARQEIEI